MDESRIFSCNLRTCLLTEIMNMSRRFPAGGRRNLSWRYERLIAKFRQKFEVNHLLSLHVSHCPCRHLVFSPRPSNLMGVRVLQKWLAWRHFIYFLQPRCHRRDGPHQNDAGPGCHDTAVYAA